MYTATVRRPPPPFPSKSPSPFKSLREAAEALPGNLRAERSNIIQKRRKLFLDAKVSPFYIGRNSFGGENVSCGQNSIPAITFPIIIRWQMDTPLCFLRPVVYGGVRELGGGGREGGG